MTAFEKQILENYEKLATRNAALLVKVTSALSSAVTKLENERSKYETFNNKHIIIKYRSVILPIILMILAAVLFTAGGVYLVKSTNRPIEWKAFGIGLTIPTK